MTHWDQFTPALYGISRKVPPESFHSQWNSLVQPLLIKEQRIYEIIFQIYSFTTDIMGLLDDYGYFLFKKTLADKGINCDSENLLQGIFGEYWRLAEDSRYWEWSNSKKTRRAIPYNRVVQAWQNHNQALIQQREELLKTWTNEN